MTVKIPEVNIYPKFSLKNIKKQFQPRNIVSAMASDGFLPVIALEAFVEAGRTYQAYKRGGFDEARERITEEFSGAVFWLGGVTGLNWLFEKIGQKILKLPNITVDGASDEVRKPLDNYLATQKRMKNKVPIEISPKLMAGFKFAKVISSVLIANAFIGFILPKINQAITRSYHKNDDTKQNKNVNNDNFFNAPSINNFGNDDKKKSLNFNGIMNLDFLKIANAFENDRTCKLLAVDAGTASGRAYSARNNNERVEILFRDLSSIYFYMFCMPHINSILNNLEHGKSTRLDPVSSKFATEYMQNYLNNQNVDVNKFEKDMLGSNDKLPEAFENKFKDKKVITLAEFNKELENINLPQEQKAKLSQTAQKMSELQPKVKNVSILTKLQVKNVFSGGLINDPEFLKAFYSNAFGNTKFMNKFKYVKQSSLDDLKSDLTDYVKSIIKDAKKANATEITSKMLKKASSKNFKLNILNWGTGFAISALFLSTLIPKMQYLITKLRTGENNFPGTEQYRNNNEVKKAA